MKKKVGVDGGEGLSHNPFAGLKVSGAGAQPTPAEKQPTAKAVKESAFAAKVVVRRENKGRGGKAVTRVSGIQPDARPAMLKRMKKALGCGGSIEGEDLVLGGAIVDRAAQWLSEAGATNISTSR